MGQYGTDWTQIISYLTGFWVGPGSLLLAQKVVNKRGVGVSLEKSRYHSMIVGAY